MAHSAVVKRPDIVAPVPFFEIMVGDQTVLVSGTLAGNELLKSAISKTTLHVIYGDEICQQRRLRWLFGGLRAYFTALAAMLWRVIVFGEFDAISSGCRMKKTPKSQINVLMDVLREFLRARGLRTRDVATALDVTERTVMRWFASEAVDTKVLEKLCALIEISFFELCEFAAKRLEGRLVQLSLDQEQALVDYPLLNYLFIHAIKGWSTAELQSEMNIPEPMLVDALIRLEKIGLIALLPGNEIRLKTARDIQWRKNGPYSRYMNMFLKWSLNRPELAEPKSLWTVEPMKFSSGSLAQLQRKFDTLKGEAVALSEQDRRSNDMSREWFSLVLAARHIDMTPLSEWPTQYSERNAL